jgi:hypothetical protein
LIIPLDQKGNYRSTAFLEVFMTRQLGNLQCFTVAIGCCTICGILITFLTNMWCCAIWQLREINL